MAHTPDIIHTESTEDRWSSWYVLTTRNPKHLEDLIAQDNLMNGGLYDCYCPYTVIPDEGKEAKEDGKYSLRAVLKCYVFVRTVKNLDEHQFVSTISGWNRDSSNTTFFLRNADGLNAKVSQRQLNIMKAYCDKVLIKPENIDVENLRTGQKISLSKIPLGDSHQEGTIQSVKRKKGGIVELRVEINLFNVKFSNLLITLENQSNGNGNSRQIYDAQQKLLNIFRRKVNNKETEATKQHDEQMLQEIMRTGNLSLPEGAMRRHHLALMLICARLMGNEDAIRQYTGMVKGLLAELAPLRESKAATDSRAWLHVALFIATGQPLYRDLAKTYIRLHNPRSTYLVQFVKQSCKTAGEKWIGLKKKHKKILPLE